MSVIEAEGLPTLERTGAGRNIVEALIIGVVLTGLSYFVGVGAGWVTELNWLEVFAVFTSYGSTYLCVRERRANYAFGAVSTAAYSVLFFSSGAFASAALNAYLAPALVYGWIRWRRDSDTRPVTRVAWKWWPVYAAVVVAAGAVAVFGMSALGAPLLFADAAILVLTILAQLLLDNKKQETWIIWAIVNIIAIPWYFSLGLYLVAFQYVFFLLNAFYGYWQWRRSMLSGGVV